MPKTSAEASTNFEIKSGESISMVASNLAADDLISNAFLFSQLYSFRSDTVFPGTYKIPTGMSLVATVDYFVTYNEKHNNKFIIHEGKNLNQVSVSLETQLAIPASEFIDL